MKILRIFEIINFIMGNCTGVFGACVGDNVDSQVIKRVDKDAMKKAMAVN
jgi:hypothetical protein